MSEAAGDWLGAIIQTPAIVLFIILGFIVVAFLFTTILGSSFEEVDFLKPFRRYPPAILEDEGTGEDILPNKTSCTASKKIDKAAA